MHDLLSKAKIEIQKLERARLVDDVTTQISSYENPFNQTIELINARNQIVSADLDPNGQTMRKAMTNIILSAYQDNDVVAFYIASQV